MAAYTITADSKPFWCTFSNFTLDENTKKFCWTCLDFIEWHKLLVKKYGKDQAKLLFLKEWSNGPAINDQADCRSFDTTFRDYFKKVDLLDSMYEGIGVIAKPIGFVTDVSSNLADTVTTTSKILKYAIPAIVIIVVIVGLVYIVKNSKEVFSGVKVPSVG